MSSELALVRQGAGLARVRVVRLRNAAGVDQVPRRRCRHVGRRVSPGRRRPRDGVIAEQEPELPVVLSEVRAKQEDRVQDLGSAAGLLVEQKARVDGRLSQSIARGEAPETRGKPGKLAEEAESRTARTPGRSISCSHSRLLTGPRRPRSPPCSRGCARAAYA